MFHFTVSENKMLFDAISDSPASVVVLLVTFFSCWSVFGLAGFHTYLAASNQTTNEDIKGSFTNKRGGPNKNPYSFENGCSNCCYVLCGPTPASLIDRRGLVTPDLLMENNSTMVQDKQPMRHDATIYANSTIKNYNTNNNLTLPTYNQNGIKLASNSEEDLISRSSSNPQLGIIVPPLPSVSQQLLHRPSSSSSTNDVNARRDYSPPRNKMENTAAIYETVDEHQLYMNYNNLSKNKKPSLLDISQIDLDLDDVSAATCNNKEKNNPISLVPLSASRLQLLQDTTMIESALDLDSLEESTSSVGANSHAGLIKKKDSL